MVGSPGDSDNRRSAGAAYVFENRNGWKQTAKLIGYSGKNLGGLMDKSGSIGISGDVIAVGSQT